MKTILFYSLLSMSIYFVPETVGLAVNQLSDSKCCETVCPAPCPPECCTLVTTDGVKQVEAVFANTSDAQNNCIAKASNCVKKASE